MDINKAIRKQNKSYKRFAFSMGFIFLMLPIILFLSKVSSLFYVIYLLLIEVLILISIIVKKNNNYLKYDCDSIRLKLKLGIASESISVFCNKMVLIDVEDLNYEYYKYKDFKIIILTSSRFRSKKIFPINAKFLRRYPSVLSFYNKLINTYPNKKYYYLIIKKGGLSKYKLLDTIYKNCVSVKFTENAIEKIKEYRKYN